MKNSERYTKLFNLFYKIYVHPHSTKARYDNAEECTDIAINEIKANCVEFGQWLLNNAYTKDGEWWKNTLTGCAERFTTEELYLQFKQEVNNTVKQA